jgi:hypothetical protein
VPLAGHSVERYLSVTEWRTAPAVPEVGRLSGIALPTLDPGTLARNGAEGAPSADGPRSGKSRGKASHV